MSPYGVAVTDEVSRCCCPTICLGELTCDPFSRWARGDSQPKDLAATVLQYQQSIEQSEGDGRNHEWVHGRDTVSMIMQERPPTLEWRPPTLCHILGDRGLPDIDAELETPWMRGAPQSGYAMLMSRMSCRISFGVLGRPPRGLDFHRQ